jgi:hypothetical protein
MFQVVSALLLTAGIYFKGGYSTEMLWRDRVKELEAKVAAAESEAKKENVVIQEKIVKQKEFIRGRTEYITQYIDKEVIKKEEVIKYVEICPVPQPIIDAHNAAAVINNAAAVMNKAAEEPKK